MLTADEFRLFRGLIHVESGLCLKENRTDFLDSRISRRMEATRSASPYRYYRYVTEHPTELLILLDLVTVNETSFFRNRPQIDLFRNRVLPELARQRETRGGPLRFWSAGCSTGEEPYTIAMTVKDSLPLLAEGDSRIFASDLSLTALEAASRGYYDAARVDGAMDDRYRRFFERKGDQYLVRDDIRSMVVFDFHNLRNDNGLSDLDAVFCRNVMIYFDEAGQRSLVERLHRSLRPGGYLFLGHTESVQGMGVPFTYVYEDRGSAYRKPLPGEAA